VDGQASASSPYTVTVTVTDGNANANASFTWTINHVDYPPVFDNLPNRTNQINDTVSVQVSAYDPYGSTLTYSATGLPAGLTISSSGLIAGTVTAAPGPYTVTVTAHDPSNAQASGTFTWTILNPSSAPGVTFVNQSGTELPLLNPISADLLQQALTGLLPGGSSFGSLSSAGYGPPYVPPLSALLGEIPGKEFWGQVWDGSGQPGSTVQITSTDQTGGVVDSITVPIVSVGAGLFRTVSPILLVDGLVTPLVRSLLGVTNFILDTAARIIIHYNPRAAWNADHTTRPLLINAVGDSVTAGMANGILAPETQNFAYPKLIAEQLGLNFGMPLMARPLLPERDFFGNTVIVANYDARTNTIHILPAAPWNRQGARRAVGAPVNSAVNDFAVPSADVQGILTWTGAMGQAIPDWGRIFARQILQGAGTQIEQARAAKPNKARASLIIAWAGNNDVLGSITQGSSTANYATAQNLTPIGTFARRYATFLDSLQAPYTAGRDKPNVIVATIPDITVVPFLLPIGGNAATPMPTLPMSGITYDGSRNLILSVRSAQLSQNIANNDAGRTASGRNFPAGSALPLVQMLLDGRGPARAGAPRNALYRFLDTAVLKPNQLANIRFHVSVDNLVIRFLAWRDNIPVVRIDSLFRQATPAPRGGGGYTTPDLAGQRITLDTTFAGGLFSNDGLHPTVTGQAAIANQFINVINPKLVGWGGITWVMPQINLLDMLTTNDPWNYKNPNRTE
jgi:hypothetical protein